MCNILIDINTNTLLRKHFVLFKIDEMKMHFLIDLMTFAMHYFSSMTICRSTPYCNIRFSSHTRKYLNGFLNSWCFKFLLLKI